MGSTKVLVQVFVTAHMTVCHDLDTYGDNLPVVPCCLKVIGQCMRGRVLLFLHLLCSPPMLSSRDIARL
jgi:hypothetical protein